MISDALTERVIESATDVAGDALRSIVYFTEDDFDQIFLRDYLSAEADIGAFVTNEREGFNRVPTHEGSELGRFQYALQRFESGFLVRVIRGEQGVFVTTNRMSMDRFDELADRIDAALASVE